MFSSWYFTGADTPEMINVHPHCALFQATSTPGEAGKRPSRNKGENIADAFQGGTSKSTPSVTKSGGVGGNPIRQSATRKVLAGF